MIDRRSRRLSALAASVVMALVIAGCSSSPTATDGETTASDPDAVTADSTDDQANTDGDTEGDSGDDDASPSTTGAAAVAEPAPGGPGELVDATTDLGIDVALAGIRGHAVATADVNGDGWQDLFVGTFADRPVESYRFFGADGPAPDRLLLGSPTGFVVDTNFETQLGRTAGALFDDLDGDGDPDLVISRNVRDRERSDAPSEIYRNDDGSLVPSSILDDKRGGRAVLATDFDGDGLKDLILVEDRWSGSSTGLFRNEGDLSFVEVTDELGFPNDVFGLGAALGDLNGDGIDDLVVGGSNRFFLGNGSGFVEGENSPLPWVLHNNEDDPAHVLLSDTNDDGTLDVLIGQHFNSTIDFEIPEPVRVYANRGAGSNGQPTFDDVTDASGMPSLRTKSPQILLLDLNDDGRQDLVTTASQQAEGEERWPLLVTNRGVVDGLPDYDGSGENTGPHYWIDAVTIDANGDGRQDLFFVEWEPELGSRLFLNLPAG